MGLLDSSKQRQGQPTLWGQIWFGHGYSHIRLGSNSLHEQPFIHPLVGYGQRGRQCRIFLLVPRSHSIRKIELLSLLTFYSLF